MMFQFNLFQCFLMLFYLIHKTTVTYDCMGSVGTNASLVLKMAGEDGCEGEVGWVNSSADSSTGIMEELFPSYPSNLALQFP